MLRMIIADDEKIIRETIRNLIDWKSLGIEVVALCENGIEAYDAIIDEYPDIVITDIKMPGLSGLELIHRITQTYDKVEFIIISGYAEFSFAAEAMQYGVKHYLLKPCNEEQIIEAIKEVKKVCYRNRAMRYMQEGPKASAAVLYGNILQNVITQGISFQEDLDAIVRPYTQIMDFTDTGYELCYFYYLADQNLEEFLQRLRSFQETGFPGIAVYKIYVKNTLLVFFESFQAYSEKLDAFANGLSFQTADLVEYKRETCDNLNALLHTVLHKIRHYDMIYFINDDRKASICNYDAFFQKTEQLLREINHPGVQDKNLRLAELKEILDSVRNSDFLKSLITNLLLKQLTQSNSMGTAEAAEFLLEINDMQDVKRICDSFYSKLKSLFKPDQEAHAAYKNFIFKIYDYVESYLSDPNLSLKWISENYLYMNVDYVSKQFVKQTGQKFSTYLNEMRIKKAKELLLECDPEKIVNIAEQVGCGNHPQYFSQLFKKYTGMTPTSYIKRFRKH